MDRLTQDEARVYDEIEPHKSDAVFKFLIPADEIVADMDTPFGRLVMKNLHTYREQAYEQLEKAINGNRPITETERIEYKQINELITNVESLVVRREKVISRVRRTLADFFTLDKPDNI